MKEANGFLPVGLLFNRRSNEIGSPPETEKTRENGDDDGYYLCVELVPSKALFSFFFIRRRRASLIYIRAEAARSSLGSAVAELSR